MRATLDQKKEVSIECWKRFEVIATKIIYALKVEAPDSEDLKQDIIIKLYEAYLRYDNLTDMLANTIARNYIKDCWRKNNRKDKNETKLDNEDANDSESEQLTAVNVLSLDIRMSYKHNGKRAYSYSNASEPERLVEESEEKSEKYKRLEALPKRLKEIYLKKANKQTLSKTDRQWIWRYNKKRKGEKLRTLKR